MKTKILLSVNVVLLGVILVMGACMYQDSKKVNPQPDNTATMYNAFLDNPIDPLFAEALANAKNMITYRTIQELYYHTWKSQYDTIMKKIRAKCKYNEDIADYHLFINEIDQTFDKLQPLILDEMFDNYDMPESPEKHSWGNGTYHKLLMYKGAVYRNACMFFISSYTKSEYHFPIKQIEKDLLALHVNPDNSGISNTQALHSLLPSASRRPDACRPATWKTQIPNSLTGKMAWIP